MIDIRIFRHAASALVIAMGTTLLAGTASAQDSPATADAAASAQDDYGLQDIVVTANKREQNLQDVGISVTAFGGDALKQLGFTNATDIVRQTPGLNILSSSASNTNVNIRGVSQNDFADHLEGPIAVYADEGYLGAAGALNSQIYDLERVEVLRGPQGTLFGRNATGGLIHYISKGPTDKVEGYAQIDVGERELVQFEGAVGGPLSDTVRARLAVAGIHSDGFVKNPIGPDPANRNNISARLQLEFDLSERTTLRLMVNGNTNHNERGLGGSASPAVPNANGLGRFLAPGENVYGVPNGNLLGYVYPTNVFERSIDSPGSFEKSVFHGQAKLTSEIGALTFTSITDYLYLKKNFLDQDVEGSPVTLFNFNTWQDYNQYSQEFRLNGESDRFKWIAGAYFLRMRGQYASSVEFGGQLLGASPFPIVTRDDYSLNTDSWSVFGQGEYKFSDTLSGIVGLRYTHDKKEVDYVWVNNVGAPTALYNKAVDPAAKRSFENVSVKAELDWRPMDGTLIYASYSRGHKGGNWALPVFPPPILPSQFPAFPHKQEVLTDYELGLKTEMWDGRARLNISAYYYDYNNYQAFSLANLAQTIVNKDGNAYGGEIELTLAPARGLDISFGASAMDSKIKDLVYPTGQLYDAELPFAAHFSFNGLVRYEWDALGGKLAAQTSFTSVGGHYFTIVNEPVNYQKRYFTADARLGYTSGDDSWNAAIWVKNLTDTEYRTFGVDISALGFAGQNYAPPRWFGASFGYKF